MSKKEKDRFLDKIDVSITCLPMCCYCREKCTDKRCFFDGMKFSETKEFNDVIRTVAKLNVPRITIRKKMYEIDVHFMEVKIE